MQRHETIALSHVRRTGQRSTEGVVPPWVVPRVTSSAFAESMSSHVVEATTEKENSMTTPITRLNPATMPDTTKLGYSQISIVETGRMAYVSGQVAWHSDGRPVPEDVVEQTKLAAANAKAALDALGAKPHDIAIIRCFMTDLNPTSLERVFPPILALFDGAMPCITGVGVAALAGPDLKVELELTVRLPDSPHES